MDIKYFVGDATTPIGEGKKLIIHVCNDIGGWGSGFVLAVSNRWKEPEAKYREMAEEFRKNGEFIPLGDVQFVPVNEEITLGNMIAQHQTHWEKGVPPIRYQALAKSLELVAEYAKMNNMSIHAPKFGAGLAGGNWDLIESLIKEYITSQGIEVTIYDYPNAESYDDEIGRRKQGLI